MTTKRRSAPVGQRLRNRWPAVLIALTLAGAGAFSLADGLAIKGKAVIAQILLERAWAKTLDGGAQVKPWDWADVWPVLKIEAPRLDASAIILSGVSGEAMAFGPGLMENGPAPGEPGLSIIAAHRDTHFRFLKDAEIGDEIFVMHANGARHTFVITETRIVKANRSGLYTDGVQPQLALVTCWPFDARERGDDRFVAIAELKEKVASDDGG